MKGLYHSPRVAAGYAYARPAVHPRILERVRGYLGSAAPVRRALDVGCGAGRSTAALEALAGCVVGIDPAAAMMEHRRAVAPHAHFVIADAERLPFSRGAFDLIAAAGAINYADPNLALPEIARVLAPHGRFVIYDFSAGRRFADDPRLASWYAEFDRRYPDPPGYQMDVTALPYDRAGLVLERHEAFPVPIPMTLDSYFSYAMSETRIELALAAGASEPEIRDWCRRTLIPVFGSEVREVVFDSYATYGVRS